MEPNVEASAKKEAAVLTETSLTNLGQEIGSRGDAIRSIVLGMYLNLPTTWLVNERNAATEQCTADADMMSSLLLKWRRMRETAKDRERVADLERALRDAGNQDLADVLADCNRENQELTADRFPQA